MGECKAVIFDIDGTLTPDNFWTAFTRDLGGSVEGHIALYNDLTDGKIELDDSKAKLLELWQETGNANRSHVEAVFDSWSVREDAHELVDWLRASNYLICLITGSVGIYAKHIADKLGVTDYYGNAEIYFDENGSIVDFDYTTDQAGVKLQQFTAYCETNGLQPSECVPVGDSGNDVELFRLTGNGILLDNDKATTELRQAAWKTIGSLSEVKELLGSK